MDTVKAAVKSGADAVYVGLKEFSARSFADNFTLEELKECIEYCHIRDVKVYLALNTLIFDDELFHALTLVKKAAEIDIDAIIVQDLGLSYAIKKMIPSLPLHASTQMTVNTKEGVKALYDLGFKRVVLSRELSKTEIKEIHDYCSDIELEVFSHGALCMSVSGQCYMSAMFGERSANRGMCAQPCRLPFMCDLKGSNALSLKDNSIIDKLPSLEEIGVKSAKIEGRMKRPEYVSVATRASKEVKDTEKLSDKTKKQLEDVFKRTAFTSGYYDGNIYDMFGTRQKEDVLSATNELFKEIRLSYKDELKKVPLSLNFSLKENDYAVLSFNDIVIESEKKSEKAINKAIDKERVIENLSKFGDTPYYLENTEVEIDEGITLPISEINLLRRKLIEELNQRRKKKHDYKVELSLEDTLSLLDKEKVIESDKKKEYIISKDLEIPENFKTSDIVFIDFYTLSDKEKIKDLQEKGLTLGVELPRVQMGIEDLVIKKLDDIKALGISDILVHSIALVKILKEKGFTVHGAFSLNVTNSFSVMFLKEYGLKDIETSIELTLEKFSKLKRFIPLGFVTYGYLPLMITRNCPAKGVGFSCESCKKNHVLQDRLNKEFRILCNKTTVEILNSVPLILPQKIYKGKNPDFVTFRFYVENYVENKNKIYEKMAKNLDFDIFTRGLSTRGVK